MESKDCLSSEDAVRLVPLILPLGSLHLLEQQLILLLLIDLTSLSSNVGNLLIDDDLNV